MLLQSNFYSIKSLTTNEYDIKAVININPAHGIFEGHFPGQPVVPGVCMIQIIKELTAQHLDAAIQLKSASQVKFLQLLIPETDKDVQVQIIIKDTDDGEYSITASWIQAEKAVMKINGRFIKSVI